MTKQKDKLITGIHHITALASDAQLNLDFYTGVLGMRFIKKTVNFDDPGTYHLYYGDQKGSPGSVMTFFPYPGIRRGRHGRGMVNTTTFSVPFTSLAYWEQRLKRFDVPFKNAQERLGNEVFIYFEDREGLGLELVFNEHDDRTAWTDGPVPAEHAIRGFHSAEIWAAGYERTGALLVERMDHKLIMESGNRFRFAANNKAGHYIDILIPSSNMPGLPGHGTIHHIAFSTPGNASQLAMQARIRQHGLQSTPIIDRQYFQSVYFREPGGVLFEIATEGPGFTVDESLEDLGKSLKLPPQYAGQKEYLESTLPAISIETKSFV